MTFQEWCKANLAVIEAAANGEEIELKCGDKWMAVNLNEMVGYSWYRIKPKTIMVNGFEVPEPITDFEFNDKTAYVAIPTHDAFFAQMTVDFIGVSLRELIGRRLVHHTKEAAIAHAKAMLGIDPNFDSEV